VGALTDVLNGQAAVMEMAKQTHLQPFVKVIKEEVVRRNQEFVDKARAKTGPGVEAAASNKSGKGPSGRHGDRPRKNAQGIMVSRG
jgi:hypothetical protein